MNSKNTKYKANMSKIIDDMKPFVGRSNFLCSDDEIGESSAIRLEECQLIKEVLIENGFENAGLSDAMGLWGQDLVMQWDFGGNIQKAMQQDGWGYQTKKKKFSIALRIT